MMFGSSRAGPCSVPAPTCTSSNGSSGVAHGKITYHSRAVVATIRPTEPASLPQRPNGSLRQIQAYIALRLRLHLGRHAGIGLGLVARHLGGQLRVHDQSLVVVELRVAG